MEASKIIAWVYARAEKDSGEPAGKAKSSMEASWRFDQKMFSSRCKQFNTNDGNAFLIKDFKISVLLEIMLGKTKLNFPH